MRKAVRVILVLVILLVGTMVTPQLGGACYSAYPKQTPC